MLSINWHTQLAWYYTPQNGALINYENSYDHDKSPEYVNGATNFDSPHWEWSVDRKMPNFYLLPPGSSTPAPYSKENMQPIIKPHVINKTHIYIDLYNSSEQYTRYAQDDVFFKEAQSTLGPDNLAYYFKNPVIKPYPQPRDLSYRKDAALKKGILVAAYKKEDISDNEFPPGIEEFSFNGWRVSKDKTSANIAYGTDDIDREWRKAMEKNPRGNSTRILRFACPEGDLYTSGTIDPAVIQKTGQTGMPLWF